MEKEMRKKERAMSEADTAALLKQVLAGTLSVVRADGTPYGVPLSFAYADGVIYLHCAMEGAKLDNVAQQPEVCFSVFDDVETLPEKFSTKYRSAVVFGRLEVVTEEVEKRKGLTALIEKYSSDFHEAGMAYIDRAVARTNVLKLTIRHMTGKARR